ncbi:MAG: (5-formylfuran-3-yl)methyl phosphate synthase [Planctomycetota bacterium]
MSLRPSDIPAVQTHSPAPSRGRFEWLVSVRDTDEAARALRFGVDIVDLKEPGEGSLGAVKLHIMEEVARRFSQSTPLAASPAPRLSVAMGEIENAAEVASQVPLGFHFAKAGPAHCQSPARLVELWQDLRQRLPEPTELVAVAYADHETAQSLPVSEIIRSAAKAGIRRLLLDTFAKSAGSSVHQLGLEKLKDIGRSASEHRLWWSLAGSIRLPEIAPLLRDWPKSDGRPDCLAIRGDACQGTRTGTLCEERLERWREFRRH